MAEMRPVTRPKLSELTAMGPAGVRIETVVFEAVAGEAAAARGVVSATLGRDGSGCGRWGTMPRRARKRPAARTRGGVGSWADAIALDKTAELGEAEGVLVCAAAWREIDPPSDTASAMIRENPAPRMLPPGRLPVEHATLHAERSRPLKGSPSKASSGANSCAMQFPK